MSRSIPRQARVRVRAGSGGVSVPVKRTAAPPNTVLPVTQKKPPSTASTASSAAASTSQLAQVRSWLQVPPSSR